MWINKASQILSVLILLCVAGTSLGDAPSEADPEATAEAPVPTDLDLFKDLAGTWEGTATHSGGDPEAVTVTYAVTAGGSAVAEALFVGSPHEMLTVFHLDDGKLMLTHYCMLGNQPQMNATDTDASDTVNFMFSGGNNIPNPDQDMHMHEASYTFIDADHIRATWTMYNQGEPAGQAVIDLHRKMD
jgi:hypothetical protein